MPSSPRKIGPSNLFPFTYGVAAGAAGGIGPIPGALDLQYMLYNFKYAYEHKIHCRTLCVICYLYIYIYIYLTQIYIYIHIIQYTVYIYIYVRYMNRKIVQKSQRVFPICSALSSVPLRQPLHVTGMQIASRRL